MFAQPLTYVELAGASAVVLAALVVAGLAARLLARHKGYDGGLWGVAGAALIGLVVLAFLPSAYNAGSFDAQARRRLIGNRIAGFLAAAAVLIAVAASFATNPDDSQLRRFIVVKLPLARDGRVASMMANGGWGPLLFKRSSYGVYSTATIFLPEGGRVRVIGFWGAWWAAAEDK
jgi:hypothetical protein